MDFILRRECGGMHSLTARALLRDLHDIEVGMYSYGPCFRPGFVPPGVHIGRYTSIAANVRIVNENHPFDHASTHPHFYFQGETRKLTTICNDVWIGLNSVVLPGCTRIGDGAIVGAGSMVTKDVPDYAIVAGNPAKLLRYRFSEDIRVALVESEWWEHDLTTLLASGLFDSPVEPDFSDQLESFLTRKGNEADH